MLVVSWAIISNPNQYIFSPAAAGSNLKVCIPNVNPNPKLPRFPESTNLAPPKGLDTVSHNVFAELIVPPSTLVLIDRSSEF